MECTLPSIRRITQYAPRIYAIILRETQVSSAIMSTEGEDLIVPQKWHKNLPRKSWERFGKIEISYT